MTTREQIEEYLKDLPSKWRKELTDILCKIKADKQEIDCDDVKECETVTTLSNFVVDGGDVSITYTDERSVQVTRSFSISDIINNSLNEVDGSCLSDVEDWEDLTWQEKIQLLIDNQCACCND